MKNSDYLTIQNDEIIEGFNGGNGAVGGGNFAGSGSFGGARGSSSRSPLTNSQGGGKQYGSFDYAYVNPITDSMSKTAVPLPNSNSSLGIIKGGAKTGTFTGGSFGGLGKYVVGFPGIKPGLNIPASSMPSLYVKPEPKEIKSTIATGPMIVPEVTKPYGKIDTEIISGIPGPKFGYVGDNVNCKRATTIRGPKYPYGVNLEDKNLTGYYGYRGYGYYFDPFYWGNGPFWTINGINYNYPDVPFDYETLMQKEIDADNLMNTVQNQIANQILEEKKHQDKQVEENFENTNNGSSCNKYTIITILAIVLIVYLMFDLPLSDTEKKVSFELL